MKKENKKPTSLEPTLSTQIGHLKDLMEHPGWKIIQKEMDKSMGKIKGVLWIPHTDQTPRFTTFNLLAERLTALFLCKNITRITLESFQQIMNAQNERNKPLQELLEEKDMKLAKELLKYIKLEGE